MSSAPIPFHDAQCRAFLRTIVDPVVGCSELRIFHATYVPGGYIEAAQQYSKTLAGWYDRVNDLVVDLKNLRGISGYITVNPVRRDLLARSDHKLTKAKHTTTDADVVCLRWLYIDVDPVRPADISSTDEELVAAVERRDAILQGEPIIAEAALWGRSGNGAWILARLPDYPNDSDHRDLVARALAVLSGRYGDDRVTIDVKTKNPSRVMCIPGTLKAKGSNRPERPWRLATLDGPAHVFDAAPAAGVAR